MSVDSSVTTPDPWLQLPPKTGKGGSTESGNYQAVEAYGQQFNRELPMQSDGRRLDSSPLAPIATGVVEVQP